MCTRYTMQHHPNKNFKRQIGAALFAVFAMSAVLAARQTPQAVAVQAAAAPKAGVDYEIAPRSGKIPGVSVVMRFAVSPDSDTVDVQMPVWSPGDYHVQNFGQYVQNLRAWAGTPDDARPLTVSRPDNNTWRIASTGAKSLTLTYNLPETPPGYFSENVQARPRQIFLNGPAVCLYPVGRKMEPARLTFDLPSGWQAECPLPFERTQADGKAKQKIIYSAPDYDTLTDSPLLAAPQEELRTLEFTLNGKPHRAVFFDQAKEIPDVKAYQPVLTAIAQAESKIMGGAPYDRYEWFFDAGGRGGGLEHLNSSRLSLRPSREPNRSADFIAHEFFHLWNVKRIRPAALGPFDYVHTPTTRNLWFAEGVTEYYAHVATRRAGLRTEREFYDHWKAAIEDFQRNPERLKISADDSSLRVWEADNSSGFGLSYYDKGELIGLCLDLKIRHVTGNRRSLDDVMRLLLARNGLPKPGYSEDGIRDAVNEIAGTDLTDFYNLLARSTQEMPFAECLEYAGLDLNFAPLPSASAAQTALRKLWVK